MDWPGDMDSQCDHSLWTRLLRGGVCVRSVVGNVHWSVFNYASGVLLLNDKALCTVVHQRGEEAQERWPLSQDTETCLPNIQGK